MTALRRHGFALCTAAALMWAPKGALAEPAKVTRITLGNGLRVLVEEDHRVARASVVVVYGVGMRDDPAGYEGLAHLVEHAMCDASAHVPEGTAKRLERAGAITNAETGQDETRFFSDLPAGSVETALWVESDRMAFMLAALDRARLSRIGQIVDHEAELRGRTDLVDEAMADALYPDGHAYRASLHGETDVRDIELDAVRWFVQRYYAPENAALAVVGDVSTDAVLAAAKKYFAPIRASRAFSASRSWSRTVHAGGPQQVTVLPPMYRNFRFERLRLAWATPAYFAEGDAALDVAAMLLSERLLDRLVFRGSAFRAAVRQESHALGSRFVVELDMVPGHGTGKALDVVKQELAELTRPSAEFEFARRKWVIRMLERLDSLSSRASLLATLAVRGLPLSMRDDLDRYTKLDAASVARAVSTRLGERGRVVVRTEFSRFMRPPQKLKR